MHRYCIVLLFVRGGIFHFYAWSLKLLEYPPGIIPGRKIVKIMVIHQNKKMKHPNHLFFSRTLVMDPSCAKLYFISSSFSFLSVCIPTQRMDLEIFFLFSRYRNLQSPFHLYRQLSFLFILHYLVISPLFFFSFLVYQWYLPIIKLDFLSFKQDIHIYI